MELLQVFQPEIFWTGKHILYFQMRRFYVFFDWKIYAVLILLKMTILLELHFDRNVDIYKISSFKVFENISFQIIFLKNF